MISGILVIAVLLTAAQARGERPPVKANAPPAPAGAAERITLRDGSVALGLITSVTGGPRGAVEFVVRREWASVHLPKWAPRWERAIEGGSRQALRQRSERLAAWRRQRAPGRPDGDRIVTWIDEEQERLRDTSRRPTGILIPVHLSRNDVRAIDRQSTPNLRLLRLGWLCGLRDVETMPLEQLKTAIEGRGFAVDGKSTPSLDGLLPLVPEPELTWLARRAATELAVDSDLRFIRHRDLLHPDIPAVQDAGAGLNGLNLSAALGELSKLLELDDARREDPLVAILKKVGESGRVGVLVTRLDLATDLGQVTVEATLWVQARTDQWLPFISRPSVVRPEDIEPGAGLDLADDPQVKAAFNVVEGLGLGKIDPAIKVRSLRMGAATKKALGIARTEIAADLNRLMLPIFEPTGGRPGPVRERPTGTPSARGTSDPASSFRSIPQGNSRPAP